MASKAIHPFAEEFVSVDEQDTAEKKGWVMMAEPLKESSQKNNWAMRTLKPGDATHYPCPGDSVRVHYTGRLMDGTMFDSSIRRAQPLHFMVGRGRVIKGFEHAIQEMSVGQKIFLLVTPQFAYGIRGYPPIIPGNATLMFELHLLSYVSSEETDQMDFEHLNAQ